MRRAPDLSDADVEHYVGVGLYSRPEASRIISQALDSYVSSTNLTRWIVGRHTSFRDYAAIVGGEHVVDDQLLISFSSLVELFTIAAMRARSISLQTIRSAHERARQRYGRHPFAKRQYGIDGSGIFAGNASGAFDMEELATGRVAFEEIVAPLLENVSYTDGDASSFRPLGPSRSVVLDPARAFGAPIDLASGTRTSSVYGMSQSGETDERIAHWYEIPVTSVRDAIEYEEALRNAA